jgi:hypothetical protein
MGGGRGLWTSQAVPSITRPKGGVEDPGLGGDFADRLRVSVTREVDERKHLGQAGRRTRKHAGCPQSIGGWCGPCKPWHGQIARPPLARPEEKDGQPLLGRH